MTRTKFIVAFATLLFFATVFFIAYTGRGNTYFAFLKHIPGGDKTGHLTLLAILAFALSWVLAHRFFSWASIRIYWGVLAVIIFITVEEFVQILSPYRTFDWIDLSCNYIGIGIAHLVILQCERFKNNQRAGEASSD